MKLKLICTLAVGGLLALTGCVGTPDGHSTAGVPFTKDTIVSRYEKPASQLATATVTVLNRNGKLLLNNTVNNSFQARVNEHNVWVKVTDIDGKVTEVDVQARGSMGADIDLAAEISKQIGMELMARQ